jgi:hypothetical protein
MTGRPTVLAVIIASAFACRSGTPSSAPHDPAPLTTEPKPMTDDDVAKLLAKLNDPDEQVRVDAAQGLHARRDPRALDACIRTIDDGADELHADHTPAVRCLIEIGVPALPAVFDLLLAAGELTRLRAQRAVEGITLALPDFQAADPQARDARWRAWWQTVGYAYDAAAQARQHGVEQLRAWAAARN